MLHQPVYITRVANIYDSSKYDLIVHFNGFCSINEEASSDYFLDNTYEEVLKPYPK